MNHTKRTRRRSKCLKARSVTPPLLTGHQRCNNSLLSPKARTGGRQHTRAGCWGASLGHGPLSGSRWASVGLTESRGCWLLDREHAPLRLAIGIRGFG